MEKRFKVLRIIGTIYKVLGGITGVLTVLSAIGFCLITTLGGAAADQLTRDFGGGSGGGMVSGLFGGILVGLVILIYGGMMTITLYGAGEGIYLFLALEENTRTTALLLQQQNAPK